MVVQYYTPPSTSSTDPSYSSSAPSTRCDFLRFFVAGAGLRVSRARFAWEAQHLVTPASVLGESVWSGVAGRCGAFPRGALRSRVLRCGSWLGRATQRADPGWGAQRRVRILVGARNAACGSWLGRAARNVAYRSYSTGTNPSTTSSTARSTSSTAPSTSGRDLSRYTVRVVSSTAFIVQVARRG